MFRVGQKVVLVNTAGWDAELIIDWDYPRKGHVYTVRDSFYDVDGEPVIRLEEISNSRGICIETGEVREPAFRASRFRPLTERKTDISIFREILRKATKQADTDIGASA